MILANESPNLSSEEMEKVLTSGVPIRRSAACALLARVGHVPAGFRMRMAPRGPAAVPSFTEPPPGPKAPLADQIRSLKGLARQSGRLHPDVRRALGDLIVEDRLTEQEILERIIRARGPTASSSLLLFALSTESHRVQNTLFLSYHCGWPPTNEPTSAYSVLEGYGAAFTTAYCKRTQPSGKGTFVS